MASEPACGNGPRAPDCCMTMRTNARIIALGLAIAAPALSQDSAVSVIPRPTSVVVGRGQFRLNAQTSIWTDAEMRSVARFSGRALEPASGLTFLVHTGRSDQSNRISFIRVTTAKKKAADQPHIRMPVSASTPPTRRHSLGRSKSP